jgi:hypothetical protein
LVANSAQRGPAGIVLNNSLAFGGYDAVVAFAKPGRLPDPSAALRDYRGARLSAQARGAAQ